MGALPRSRTGPLPCLSRSSWLLDRAAMPLTLRQAAKEAGVAKTTLIRALRSGRLSAQKNDLGDWAIDPSELHRVFPLRKADRRQSPDQEDQEDQGSAPMVLDRDASPLKTTP